MRGGEAPGPGRALAVTEPEVPASRQLWDNRETWYKLSVFLFHETSFGRSQHGQHFVSRAELPGTVTCGSAVAAEPLAEVLCSPLRAENTWNQRPLLPLVEQAELE